MRKDLRDAVQETGHGWQEWSPWFDADEMDANDWEGRNHAGI